MSASAAQPPMHLYPFKLVTIIAEPVLEPRITTELSGLGATGFTVVEGRGEGSRALHAAEIPGINVRIETIVPPDVADRILQHLASTYFTDYEVIAYLSDVLVLRPEKYRSS